METHKPIRPPKSKLPPVSKPDTSGAENKYARKTLIGPAKCKDVVNTVGLGNLNVETTYGKSTDV
jgi:hypothetical protein